MLIDGTEAGYYSVIEAVLDNIALQGEALPCASIDDLLELARGTYPSSSVKEGIVIRPFEPIYSLSVSTSLSYKVINNDYLLKKANSGELQFEH